MSDYHEKYLKYKMKYFELKKSSNKKNNIENINIVGGLVGDIDKSKINALKSEDEIPEIINKYVKIITIPDTKVIRVGSAMFKIQPYFSDIDVMNIVYRKVSSEELVKFFISSIKKMLKTILEIPNVFFSDFKAGGFHWSIEQIMKEKYDQLSLYDACFIKDVIKLDIIAPYDGRYVEMSTFFVLKSINTYINVESDYFDTFKQSLLTDIAKYQDAKPFKAVKRVWSLARITNGDKIMESLKNLIKSNVSLLSQINADVETLILLLEHKSDYKTNFVLAELDGFKEKLSTVLDIQIDNEKINLMIDNIKLLYKFSEDKNVDESHVLIDNLTRLHNHLLKIINRETNEYLRNANFKFPVEKEPENKLDEIDITQTDIIENI